MTDPLAPQLVTVEDHRARILAAITPLPAFDQPLMEAFGLSAAEDVHAQVALPGFDNSGMDGYAVCHDDVAGATAESPVHQEERGDWQGTIAFENDDHLGLRIVTGANGSGSVSVTVVDSDTAYARVGNAEVTLLRGGAAFDFGTSDANGVAYFANVPAGSD